MKDSSATSLNGTAKDSGVVVSNDDVRAAEDSGNGASKPTNVSEGECQRALLQALNLRVVPTRFDS